MHPRKGLFIFVLLLIFPLMLSSVVQAAWRDTGDNLDGWYSYQASKEQIASQEKMAKEKNKANQQTALIIGGSVLLLGIAAIFASGSRNANDQQMDGTNHEVKGSTPSDGISFCSKCGKRLCTDDNFCSGCGTKIEKLPE